VQRGSSVCQLARWYGGARSRPGCTRHRIWTVFCSDGLLQRRVLPMSRYYFLRRSEQRDEPASAGNQAHSGRGGQKERPLTGGKTENGFKDLSKVSHLAMLTRNFGDRQELKAIGAAQQLE